MEAGGLRTEFDCRQGVHTHTHMALCQDGVEGMKRKWVGQKSYLYCHSSPAHVCPIGLKGFQDVFPGQWEPGESRCVWRCHEENQLQDNYFSSARVDGLMGVGREVGSSAQSLQSYKQEVMK